MDAHRVHVFDEADRNFMIFGVAHDLQFQLFPAAHGLFNQHLANETRGEAAIDNYPQFVEIIGKPAARAAHRIGRTNHDRKADLLHDFFRFFKAVRNLALRHVNAQARHRVFERLPVFAALNRVNVDADDFDAVLLKDARFRERGR